MTYYRETHSLHRLHNLPEPEDFFIVGNLYRWTWGFDSGSLKREDVHPFDFIFHKNASLSIANDYFESYSSPPAKIRFFPEQSSIFLCTNAEQRLTSNSLRLVWKIDFLSPNEKEVYDILFNNKIWNTRWQKICL